MPSVRGLPELRSCPVECAFIVHGMRHGIGFPVFHVVPARMRHRQPCSSDPLWLRRQVIFSALAAGGPSQATSAEALQRLLFDVFQRDVREFRCASQPRSREWSS